MVYLWERINVLTRVLFYCIEERMKLGKIFRSPGSNRTFSRNNRTYSMVTRSGDPLSRRFSYSLVSPVVAGTFPFLGKLPGLLVSKLKNLSPSFTSSLQYNPGLWDSCLAKPKQAWNRSWYGREVLETMVYNV